MVIFSIGLSCLANEIEADEMFAGLLTLVNGEGVTVDPDIAEFTIVDDESKNNNQCAWLTCDIYIVRPTFYIMRPIISYLHVYTKTCNTSHTQIKSPSCSLV